MALSSSSTLSAIKAAYLDNANYEASGSTTEAQAFIEACRCLLVALPAEIEKDGESLTLNPQLVQGELAQARRWLVNQQQISTNGGGAVRHVDFRDFRS